MERLQFDSCPWVQENTDDLSIETLRKLYALIRAEAFKAYGLNKSDWALFNRHIELSAGTLHQGLEDRLSAAQAHVWSAAIQYVTANSKPGDFSGLEKIKAGMNEVFDRWVEIASR